MKEIKVTRRSGALSNKPDYYELEQLYYNPHNLSYEYLPFDYFNIENGKVDIRFIEELFRFQQEGFAIVIIDLPSAPFVPSDEC